MTNTKKNEELEDYQDPQILSADAPVSTWLKILYFTLPIWGAITFYFYWNGSHGWLDRGYWNQLQKGANTTFPYKNMENPKYDPFQNDSKTKKPSQ